MKIIETLQNLKSSSIDELIHQIKETTFQALNLSSLEIRSELIFGIIKKNQSFQLILPPKSDFPPSTSPVDCLYRSRIDDILILSPKNGFIELTCDHHEQSCVGELRSDRSFKIISYRKRLPNPKMPSQFQIQQAISEITAELSKKKIA